MFRIAEADSHRVQGISQTSSGFVSGHSDFTDEGVHNVTGESVCVCVCLRSCMRTCVHACMFMCVCMQAIQASI